MKTFAKIRESSKKIKIDGVKVEMKKTARGFETYVDGDKFDTFKTEKQAEKMAKELIQNLKSKK